MSSGTGQAISRHRQTFTCRAWLGSSEPARIVEAVSRLEGLGWIWGLEQPEQAPTETLERLLPTLLPDLSSTGQALLADQQGLQIAFSGFEESQAQPIAAISADAIALATRQKTASAGSIFAIDDQSPTGS